MASGSDESPTHRRNRTSQGIPLQTLHPNGVQDPDDETQQHGQHRRTLSDRGRALFRSSRQTSPEHQRRYAPIGEDSPSPPERQERMPLSPTYTCRRRRESDQGYRTRMTKGLFRQWRIEELFSRL